MSPLLACKNRFGFFLGPRADRPAPALQRPWLQLGAAAAVGQSMPADCGLLAAASVPRASPQRRQLADCVGSQWQELTAAADLKRRL